MRETPIALTTMLLAVSLTGCGPAETQPVTLPPLTPSTTATTASPTPGDSGGDEAAVEAVYVDWQAHLDQGQDMSKSVRRDFLAKWLTDPALTEYTDAADKLKERYTRVEGKRIPHVVALEVDGATATIEDCNDVSDLKVMDSRTGRSLPTAGDWLLFTASAKKTADGWRIHQADAKPQDECAQRVKRSPSAS